MRTFTSNSSSLQDKSSTRSLFVLLDLEERTNIARPIERALIILRIEAVSGLDPAFAGYLGFKPIRDLTITGERTMSAGNDTSITPIDETFSATFYQPSQTLRGKLVVHGEVRDATLGWRLRLVPARPHEAHTRELRLVLEAIPPTDIQPQHEVETEISYVRSMRTKLYDRVSISNPHGPGLTLNVAILVSET